MTLKRDTTGAIATKPVSEITAGLINDGYVKVPTLFGTKLVQIFDFQGEYYSVVIIIKKGFFDRTKVFVTFKTCYLTSNRNYNKAFIVGMIDAALKHIH